MIYINPEHTKQQVLFFEGLLNAAIERANSISAEDALYDLQGRMLFLLPKTPQKGEGFALFERDTVVSFDVQLSPIHHAFLYQKLARTLEEQGLSAPGLVETLPSINTGSMIALTQEFYFHLKLATAIYAKAFSSHFDDRLRLDMAQNEAMLQLERELFQTVAYALSQSFDGHSVHLAPLNQSLDKARPKLMRLAHGYLRDAIVRQYGEVITPQKLQDINLLPIAKQTSATDCSMLHLDVKNGLFLWIEGTTETAHERRHGPHFAHRQVITHFLDQQRLCAHPHPRLQIRTPSPVIKIGATDDGFIQDACVKLSQIPSTYVPLNAMVSDRKPLMFDAFIYHQLTALHDKKGDQYQNLQTQSARHVLLGAHLYNQAQLDTQRPLFCLVQGIGVNGFGVTLSYGSDPLQNEQTLMAELALAYTLCHLLSSTHQDQLTPCFEAYLAFLSEKQTGFFSDDPRGQDAIIQLNQLKKTLKRSLNGEPYYDAHGALLALFKANGHMHHRYAKLIQALSIFLNPFALVGCKSGNERTQAINGRVGVLDLLLHPTLNLTPPLLAIKATLKEVADSQNPLAVAEQLKTLVDIYYNDTLLQSGYGLISLADQGATAKLTPKTRHFFKRFNRNQAEEGPEIMRYLSQVYAGPMQAHHQMTKEMIRAFQPRHGKWRLFNMRWW